MNKKFTRILTVILTVAGLSTTARAISIYPNFIGGAGQTWSDVQKAVINRAIADWQTALPDNRSINVTFDFTHAGTGYLGAWQASYNNVPYGMNLDPWTPQVVQTIHFNVDYFSGANYTWWDPSPTTSSDQPFEAWDALSVARHEIGHMLGIAKGTYFTSAGAPQTDKWTSHVSGSTFDPGGLNVSLSASNDIAHVLDGGTTAGDLMVPSISNSIRRTISATDLNMLHLAYGYTVVLPATSTTYTLTAAAGKTAIHTGGSCSITSTITNTGTGSADTLDYAGLQATTTSGATIGGSSTSGGPLAKAGGSASNAGLTFRSSTAGTYTITPAATATNHTLGTAATRSSATPVTVTVYTGQGNFSTSGQSVWTDPSKWTTYGGVPGIDGALSANDSAFFNISASTTVSLNGANPRLARLELYNTNDISSFNIARGTGNGTLTLQAPTGMAAEVLVYQGANTISAPVVLGGDARIGCDYDATINFSGGISGNHTLTVWIGKVSASSIQVNSLRIGNFAKGPIVVPEPSTLALLGSCIALLLLACSWRWRKA